MSKSLLSGGTGPGDGSARERGSFFPYKLGATLSALKIVGGCVLVGLGAAAMVQRAGQAGRAAGIAGGVIVIISGVLGAYAVRTGAARAYVVSFLLSCLASLAAAVTIIIYSASGLAEDSSRPWQGGDSRHSRETAMLINTILIIVGFLDVVFSIPSVIVCLRELCDCYNPALLAPPPRKDWRLLSWLGHQSAPVFYSPSSGVPYTKLPPGSPYHFSHHSPPFIRLPSEPLSSSGPASRHSPREAAPPRPRPRSRSPRHPLPRPVYRGLPQYHAPPHYAPPPLELYAPYYPAHPYYYSAPPPDWSEYHQYPPPPRSRHAHSQRKRSRSKSQQKETKRQRRKGPTDSDIEKTYTGMDRELAEEFIEQTMDPSQGAGEQTVSGTESEAW